MIPAKINARDVSPKAEHTKAEADEHWDYMKNEIFFAVHSTAL